MTMNTFIKYLSGSALLFGLWSCASDEPAAVETPKFEENQAMMTINILGPTGLTRAGADGGEGDYDDGTVNENVDENKVGTVSYYFYDAAGEFATAVENVTPTPTFVDSDDDNFLVEKIGQSKIVLSGLTGKDYPSYMLAVLNGGANVDLKNKSMEEAIERVRTSEPWTSTGGKYTNFVMTSATHDGNSSDAHYVATALQESHFAEMKGEYKPGDDFPTVNPDGSAITAVPVEIYVERLAAKVKLNFSSSFQKTGDYYELTLPDEYNINSTMSNVKIRLLGWDLNGTAKSTKYFKKVNEQRPFITDDGWDYSGTNRCYWAMTPNYGNTQYPSSFEDVEKKYDGSVVNNLAGYDAQDEILNYISWNTVKNSKFTQTTKYVRPNTDRSGNIVAGGALIHGGVTEALIAAQIVDETGKPLSLYQIGMQFFTEDKIVGHVLHSISDLSIWKKTVDNLTSQITEEDLEIAFGFDGTFKLSLTSDAKKTEWFKDSQCTDRWDSTSSYQAVADYINSHLPSNQTYGYKDGMMYYNIPIRHLRGFGANNAIQTGTYGVVRNHSYNVTVTDIKNLGHSVYRPNEDIIPPSDATRFMIGSSIKILSWRLVNQTVEL